MELWKLGLAGNLTLLSHWHVQDSEINIESSEGGIRVTEGVYP